MKTAFHRQREPRAEQANEEVDQMPANDPASPDRFDGMDADDVFGGAEPVRSPMPEPTPNRRGARQTTVEDAEEDDNSQDEHTTRYVEGYPGTAGVPLNNEIKATPLEKLAETYPVDSHPFGPFRDEDEWELGEWMATNIGKGKADELLNLRIVSLVLLHVNYEVLTIAQIRKKANPSFHNARKLYQHIDDLPEGPGWTQEILSVEGDLKNPDGSPMLEEVELWRRDPVECIRELMGDSAFDGEMAFAPERVYADKDGKERVYDKMWTADWWWDVQVSASADGQRSTACQLRRP